LNFVILLARLITGAPGINAVTVIVFELDLPSALAAIMTKLYAVPAARLYGGAVKTRVVVLRPLINPQDDPKPSIDATEQVHLNERLDEPGAAS
jgi:hypothetical protein